MTLREKMLCCYHGEALDEPVTGIYTRYLKRGTMERLARDNGLGIIEYVSYTTQTSPPWHLIPEFISEVKNTDISIEYYWEHGQRKHRRKYVTPVGTLYAEVGASVGDGSEHISHYYISSPEDYAIMKYIVENTVLHNNEGMYRARVADLGDDGVVMARVDRTPYQKLMHELVGANNFLMDILDDPDPIEELMDVMTRRLDEQMEITIASPADLIWMPENVTVDMTPPAFFEQYHLDLYKKYTKWAHEAGKTVIGHFDGKIKLLAPQLRESGLDALESLSEPSIGGDCTYEELCELFPNQVLLPNFPANLADDTDGLLEEHVRNVKATAKKYGRSLMLQISEDLPAGTYEKAIPRIVAAMNE